MGTDVMGVKLRVTGTNALPEKRSEVAMAKATADTCPIINPELTGEDAAVSVDV